MNWFIPTSPNQGLLAQNKLLSHFIRSSFESKTCQRSSLNYIEIKRKSNKSLNKDEIKKEKTLVLMHGFGLGLGFFYGIFLSSTLQFDLILTHSQNLSSTANFDALGSQYDRVIAVDWLGMGNSTRIGSKYFTLPLSTQLYSAITNKYNVTESSKVQQVSRKVTDQFIDNFEEFRKEQNIHDFVLAGHSLISNIKCICTQCITLLVYALYVIY